MTSEETGLFREKNKTLKHLGTFHRGPSSFCTPLLAAFVKRGGGGDKSQCNTCATAYQWTFVVIQETLEFQIKMRKIHS